MTVVEGHIGRSAGSSGALPQRDRKEAATRRNVVVVMPFGDEDADRRRAILNFTRLKYIVEKKCRVVPKNAIPAGARVAYDVAVASTAMDNIPEVALRKIKEADIVIALLTERNYNVAFELGFRRALGKNVIIVSKSPAELPIYEADVAFQDWKEETVLDEIEHIVAADFTRLTDFEVNIPSSLKQAIDAKDGTLTSGLQDALEEVEGGYVAAVPESVQKVYGMLSDAIYWFYPCSIVEVRFSERGTFENADAPATVVQFDDAFTKFYGYGNKNIAELDRPLSLGLLLDKICQFSDPDDWQAFLKEQTTLTEKVIRGYASAYASVPIRFNDSHPDSNYAGKSFLPCMAAQVIDGKLDGPHRMYLLVTYIRVGGDSAPSLGASA